MEVPPPENPVSTRGATSSRNTRPEKEGKKSERAITRITSPDKNRGYTEEEVENDTRHHEWMFVGELKEV